MAFEAGSLDILIRFLLDEAAQKRLVDGVSSVAEELEKAGVSAEDAEESVKKFGDEIEKSGMIARKGAETVSQSSKKVTDSIESIRKAQEKQAKFESEQWEKLSRNKILLAEYNKRIAGQPASRARLIELEILGESADLIKAAEEAEKKKLDAINATSRGLLAQARILNNQVTQIRARSAELTRLSSIVGGVSRTGFTIGVGVVGGIFAAASKYVNDAKEATAVTRQWKAAQEDLNKAGERIGAVLAKEALPILRMAAKVAGETAAFVEKHPEIVSAALNTGIIVAGLSAIGILVSKGIKLYADVLYLASVPIQLQAARLQAAAAEQQLVAATLRAESKGLDVATAAGPIALALGATIGLSAVVARQLDKLEELMVKKFGERSKILVGLLEELVSKTLPGLNLVSAMRKFVLPGIDLLKKKAEELQGVGTGGGAPEAEISETRQQALQSYIKYREDDAQLVKDHYAQRLNIVRDALRAEQTSNARYSASVAQVNQQRLSGLGDAMRNFTESNLKAEQDYALQRSKVVQDGGKEIQKIEADLQERLRKMNLDHADRVDDLTRARDALGLVKEQRDFNRARAEETRDANLEIMERRRDLAERLIDLAKSHEQERAQRLADYKARVIEIGIQARERLAELAAHHAAELKDIRRARIEKLRELDAQLTEERRRRREQFIASIRDLDTSMLGERRLRDQYNRAMLSDLDRFLSAYRTRLGTLSGSAFAGATSGAGATPTATKSTLSAFSPYGRAAGGYATFGRYILGDNESGGRGRPEYILSGRNTEMAERLIGGSLTQQRLMSALMFGGGGGARNQIAYNDNRRIDSRISRADRDSMVREAVDAMSDMMKSVS